MLPTLPLGLALGVGVANALPQLATATTLVLTTATTITTTDTVESISSFTSAVTDTFTTSGLVTTSTSAAATSVQTAIPTPAYPLNSTLPSQAPLPPKQAWCPSEIYCAGELLQTVNLAYLYPDSKTFADKPTVDSSNVTLTNFDAIVHGSFANVTIGDISNFVQTNFKGEGLELDTLTLNDTSVPAFLQSNDTIPDPLARAWAGVVNSYWGQLIRDTDETTLCQNGECESSLIPLNHTFVVPGGRFREQYYWDSYWIMEGLLTSELYDIARSTLENFMDELDQFGFIPNGGRIYYLNRSQPPLFIHMLYQYVTKSGDTEILDRALPLADKELTWWATNRTISVKSPYTKKTHLISHYAVNNSAPRPESYREDYETANGADLTTPYTEQQKADLYAELASGAETGWDYTARWSKSPFANVGNTSDTQVLLRSLNVRGTAAADLNSILYLAELLLSELYVLPPGADTGNATATFSILPVTSATVTGLKKRAPSSTAPAIATTKTSGATVTVSSGLASATGSAAAKAAYYRKAASARKAAILDLMWDSEKLAFYDFNLTSNARSGFFSAASFYPYWNNIWPDDLLKDEKKAQAAFSSVGLVLSQYNGTFPATFVTTGLQWDAPNTWPPHQYIVAAALASVPPNISTQAYPTLGGNVTSFSLIPTGQLGLTQDQLPTQSIAGSNQTLSGDVNYSNGTWRDAGASSANETWSTALLRGVANRYYTSVFCSWYSTGGSIPGLLAQLPPDQLNTTNSDVSSTGHMYEKLNLLDIDAAGSGGEYTVQAGFGWTNGAVLWFAANHGKLLSTPTCPQIIVESSSDTTGSSVLVGRRVKRSSGVFHKK